MSRRAGQPTYSHLAQLGRAPSEYEIVSTQLLYHVHRGLETDLPLAGWFERYQRKSVLQCDQWDAYLDPRATTYTLYTRRAAERERELDRELEPLRQLPGPSEEQRAVLSAVVGPLRFPIHGLQMVAAYVGHLAPSGRIAMCALFQSADEIRRIDHLAYRTCELMEQAPDFGRDAKDRWERAETFQPLRALIERLLVCYDFGEALVALNLGVKPLFDAMTTVHLADAAATLGDPVLAGLLRSAAADCAWHQAWCAGLLRHASAQRSENAGVIREMADRWARDAAHALAPLAEACQLDPDSYHGLVRRVAASRGTP